jgi:hypothetical protein
MTLSLDILAGRPYGRKRASSRVALPMRDFPRLLLDASMTMGTPLAVAKLLDVQPNLVYAWMAERERPSSAGLEGWKRRLEAFLRSPKPAGGSHPRRRAFDARLALVAAR